MYNLKLTPEDWRTIYFVGNRYEWSHALSRLDDETVERMPEHVAWELVRAFEADTEGGHSLFPLLDPRSELTGKLLDFMLKVV